MSREKQQPDTEVEVINLSHYDWIVVNSSGGKDSQASLDKLIETADRQKFPRSRIVVAHADLGDMEWPGTKELVLEHAAHYGLRVEIEKRPQGDLLTQVEQRGMWPSSKQRYCTSDHKRGQVAKIFTKLTKETRDARLLDRNGVELPYVEPSRHDAQSVSSRRAVRKNVKAKRRKIRFLNVFGFRAEESPARAKHKPFEKDERLSNTLRHVDRWLPIHHWKLRDVWHRIEQAGTRKHWAYARGMTRLSCRFCIFAPKSQLIISASQPENQQVFDRYVQVEIRIGHKFKQKESLQDIKREVQALTPERLDQLQAEDKDGCWGM